jgi:FkbM family methyltransferase
MNLLRAYYDSTGGFIREDASGVYIQKGERLTTLRQNSSDKEVFRQIYCTWEYYPLVHMAQLNQVEVHTIVDLGANIGVSAVFMDEFFPGSRIICVEPDAGNMQMLKQNTTHVQHIEYLQKAIWNENRTVYLDRGFRDGLDWSAHVTDHEADAAAAVDGITLNELIRQQGLTEIGVLKIDIEGAEIEMFRGDAHREFLAITRMLSIELHPDAGDTEPILDILRESGFALFKWGETVFGLKH